MGEILDSLKDKISGSATEETTTKETNQEETTSVLDDLKDKLSETESANKIKILKEAKEVAKELIEKKILKESLESKINFVHNETCLNIQNGELLKHNLLKLNLMLNEGKITKAELDCFDIDGNDVKLKVDEKGLRNIMSNVAKFDADMYSEISTEKSNIDEKTDIDSVEAYTVRKGLKNVVKELKDKINIKKNETTL